MKLDEVKKIKQCYQEDGVNEYLSKGYRILKIFSTKTHTDELDEVRPCYVLGLAREHNKNNG